MATSLAQGKRQLDDTRETGVRRDRGRRGLISKRHRGRAPVVDWTQGDICLADVVAQHQQTLSYLQGLLVHSPVHSGSKDPTPVESPPTATSTPQNPSLTGSARAASIKASFARVQQTPRPTSPPAPLSYAHKLLDDTFRQLETSMVFEDLSGPEDDDHLLICAITMGWDAVGFAHKLDTVWQFLRMFDKHIYPSMERIGRLAALRALRALLIHKIRPLNQPVRAIPPFLKPTMTQQATDHSPMIDYFAWPSVRDHLITSGSDVRRTPPSSHTSFAMNFNFDWPFLFGDVYMTLASSGRHVFSKEFDVRFNDLACWQIACHDDTSLIPAHLQFDRGLLVQYEHLLQRDHDVPETPESTDKADWAERPGADLPTLSSLDEFSFDDTGDVAGAGYEMSDEFHESISGSPAELPESQLSAAEPDEWAWAFDSSRPEYGVIQSLLDVI